MRKLKIAWWLVPLLVLSLVGTAVATSITSKTADNKLEWAFTKADQNPEQLLISVINGAQTQLDIAIYSLTHPDIVAAIRDAKKRGVNVRLITDKQQAGGQSQTEALKILGSAGVPTKINAHSGLMHLKVVVADKKVATIGSFNFSKAASTTNDEVLMVLRDEAVAISFAEEFERMWNNTQKFQSVEYRIAQPAPASSSESKPAQAQPPVNQTTSPQTAVPSAAKGCEKPAIKGNKNSMIYHVPGGQSYDKTTANVELFCTEEEAQKAGYRKAQR
ncbi:phospholipase D-like domain-containing protein [Brevibacillus sp. TJ4]|uniref:phospholipase D-like domain-containing protein n=1 Tax=Brevibacillus sp. TJ4 TaxID=3234853 RepID=UPI0037CFE1FA